MAEKVKPRWLILGGLGFIGRNLVKYLVDNNLASAIRIADKKAPFMSFLSPDYKAAILENPVVECIQVDVSDDDMLGQAFAPPSSAAGGASGNWDFVVNLAAETALGKSESFYQKAVDGAAKSGAIAASIGVRKYVFVSSASVYKSDKSASKEDGKIAPWTSVAESMARAEAALTAVAGLPLVILRPALVYGPGDFASLMPRCVVAASYKKSGEKMEMLWDGDMKLSTVHVFDVARAIVHAARKMTPADGALLILNLADKGDTDAGKITALLGQVFGIPTGFMGSVKSNIANLKLDAVVDAANENHLGPWLALLKEHGIKNTPLSPYLHKSLLSYNHLCVDGSAIEGPAGAGFKYAIPGGPTLDLVRDPIAQHIGGGIFPPVIG